MPIIGSFGAGSGRGYGLTGVKPALIKATGGTISQDGDYRIHTFTGSGTFEVQEISPLSPGNVDYLVVAGGGSSGQDQGGAGGAGGFRESYNP